MLKLEVRTFEARYNLLPELDLYRPLEDAQGKPNFERVRTFEKMAGFCIFQIPQPVQFRLAIPEARASSSAAIGDRGLFGRWHSMFGSVLIPACLDFTSAIGRLDLLPERVMTNPVPRIDAAVRCIQDGAPFPGVCQDQPLELNVILHSEQHGHSFAVACNHNRTGRTRVQERTELCLDLSHRRNLHSFTFVQSAGAPSELRTTSAREAPETSPVTVFHAAEATGLHPFFICVGREDEPCRICRATCPGYAGEALPLITLEFRQAADVPRIVLKRMIPDTLADASVLPWADSRTRAVGRGRHRTP
jgi:hypothetical protein